MSKNSSKQLVTQFKEWLSTRKTSSPTVNSNSEKAFSKANHYKKSTNRYGNKSN
jgi:hypothetical protein